MIEETCDHVWAVLTKISPPMLFYGERWEFYCQRNPEHRLKVPSDERYRELAAVNAEMRARWTG